MYFRYAKFLQGTEPTQTHKREHYYSPRSNQIQSGDIWWYRVIIITLQPVQVVLACR